LRIKEQETRLILHQHDDDDDDDGDDEPHLTTVFFHSRTVHLDIIKVFYLPTDAQENWFKKNIKIYIKTAPTCFGLITIIREGTIRVC